MLAHFLMVGNPEVSVMHLFLPNILAGRAAELLDGATLLLVLVPARGLAGSVAVVGKLALSAAVQIGLMAEAAVAHLGGQTERETQTG